MQPPPAVGPFTSYWAGYRDNGTPTPLCDLPRRVNVVALAFAGLGKDNRLDLTYFLRDFGELRLREWSAIARAKGQRVTMSLQDLSPEHTGGTWQDLNLEVFAKNAVAQAMHSWELDGFDLDCEGTGIERLAELIPLLRREAGPAALMSLTVYTQSDTELAIITAAKSCITHLQTMAYWDSFDEMVTAAKWYADKVGDPRKVYVGVRVGSTPLDQCTRIAQWTQQNGFGGVMAWSTDMDNATFTHQPLWTWTDAIANGLEPPTQLI